MVTPHRRALPRRRRAAARSINRVTRKDENVYLDALGPGRDAVRRPHGGQHDRAGRRLPGRRDPGERRGDRGGDRAQRRVGRDEHAGLPRRPAARGRSGVGWRRSSGTALGAAVETARAADAPTARALVDRVGADGELRAAARDPRARADRLPGRSATRARYVDFVQRVRDGRAGGRARRDAAERGRRALPVQADGLQGRVRGGAPAPARPTSRAAWPRSSRAACACSTTCTRRCSARSASSASSSSARGSTRAFRALLAMKRPARHRARSVRPRRGAARGARAARRVPRADRAGARRPRRPRPTSARSQLAAPARHDPRLRGHQARATSRSSARRFARSASEFGWHLPCSPDSRGKEVASEGLRRGALRWSPSRWRRSRPRRSHRRSPASTAKAWRRRQPERDWIRATQPDRAGNGRRRLPVPAIDGDPHGQDRPRSVNMAGTAPAARRLRAATRLPPSAPSTTAPSHERRAIHARSQRRRVLDEVPRRRRPSSPSDVSRSRRRASAWRRLTPARGRDGHRARSHRADGLGGAIVQQDSPTRRARGGRAGHRARKSARSSPTASRCRPIISTSGTTRRTSDLQQGRRRARCRALVKQKVPIYDRTARRLGLHGRRTGWTRATSAASPASKPAGRGTPATRNRGGGHGNLQRVSGPAYVRDQAAVNGGRPT